MGVGNITSLKFQVTSFTFFFILPYKENPSFMGNNDNVQKHFPKSALTVEVTLTLDYKLLLITG